MSTATSLGSVLAATAGTTTETGTAEAVAFWILAPISVAAAMGMLLMRKAVHSALMLAITMISLAILYVGMQAPFLGVVQVVVYTGAIMMLFLFVLMLVGVDSSDSLVETIRGQRIAAVLAGLGFAVLLIAAIGRSSIDTVVGLDAANANGNVEGIAELIFSRYVWAFEVTSALLITAALAAMVLAHRERYEEAVTQRERSEDRFRPGAYAAPLPSPGVYARHNAVDTPALLPDGTPTDLSIPASLLARGDLRRPGRRADDVTALEAGIRADRLGIRGPAGGSDPARSTSARSTAAESTGSRTGAAGVDVSRADATDADATDRDATDRDGTGATRP